MNVCNTSHGLSAKVKFKHPGLLQFRGEAHVVSPLKYLFSKQSQVMFLKGCQTISPELIEWQAESACIVDRA